MPLRHFEDPHGYLLPEDQLKNVLIHNLKEEMMQRFLSGASVDRVLRGRCQSIAGDAPAGPWHGFALEHPSDESAAGESLRNHICLLLDEQKVRSIMDEYQSDIPESLCERNVHLHIPLSVICGVRQFPPRGFRPSFRRCVELPALLWWHADAGKQFTHGGTLRRKPGVRIGSGHADDVERKHVCST